MGKILPERGAPLNWIDKLERKLGRFAISKLTLLIIGGNALGYLMAYTMPQYLLYLTLEPALILKGQVWRLLTWLIVPVGGNVLSVVITLFFYYSIGTAMERTWGDFRYNLYIFSGILFTVLGVFILYFISGGGYGYGLYVNVYYVCVSIFLAFAVSYPDMEVLLYFVLPLKVKWLAWIDAAYLIYGIVQGNTVSRVVIITSVLNFLLFFLSDRRTRPNSPKERIRKAKYKKQVRPKIVYANGAKHRCAVCGRTELDDPNLEFRFCSKCNGNFEYCQDHLFTHEHVK